MDKVPNSDDESHNSLLQNNEEFKKEKEEIVFKLFRRNLSVFISNVNESKEPLAVEASSTTPNLILEKEKSIFRDRSVITVCSAYALLGFIFTMLDEVFPLWSMQDVSVGGLNFTTNSIGIANSIAGLMTVMIQLFIYHRVANRLGLIRTFRIGSLLSIPAFLAFPTANIVYVHVFNQSTALLWVYFAFLFILRQMASQMAFSSVMNLISNSVDSTNMGAVNGLGQSLVAATRAIGPVTGASLLAWSLSNNMGFPFNFYFVFLVLGFGLAMCFLITIKLDKSLNIPKDPDSDKVEEPNELS